MHGTFLAFPRFFFLGTITLLQHSRHSEVGTFKGKMKGVCSRLPFAFHLLKSLLMVKQKGLFLLMKGCMRVSLANRQFECKSYFGMVLLHQDNILLFDRCDIQLL
jgi:hypothetical protein